MLDCMLYGHHSNEGDAFVVLPNNKGVKPLLVIVTQKDLDTLSNCLSGVPEYPETLGPIQPFDLTERFAIAAQEGSVLVMFLCRELPLDSVLFKM